MRTTHLSLCQRAGAALMSASLLAACSSTTAEQSSTAKESDLSSELQTELQGYYDASTTQAPPAEGPAPQPGKNLWILSCGESISNCAITTATAEDAAKKMGWKTTVFDTNYDPSKMAEGMSQAIAAGADGVFTYAIDCVVMKQPLALARKAGVAVVGAEALDCDPPGFAANVSYAEGDSEDFYKAIGRAQAIATLAAVGENADILIPFETDALNQKPLVDEYKATIEAECPDCEMTVFEWTIPDMGANLEQKVQQALVQDPGINAIQFGYTGILTSGPLAGIRAAGRNDIFMALGDPQPEVNQMIADGTINGTGVGFSVEWEALAAIDNLNRIFNGEEPSNSGIGIQLYNADHNLDDGEWVPPVDFREAYDKLFTQG